LELPLVSRSIVSLRQTEMFPFERLARIAPSMMTAHVVFSAFDRLPATLSPRLCDGLLRKEFGFEGVLFSDDLEMAALAKHWPLEEAAIRSVVAGCDVLLICSNDEVRQRVHKALVDKIRESRAFRERCQEAVTRSLIARRRFEVQPVDEVAELVALLADQETSEAGRWLRQHARSRTRRA
jgi:beta-N-acetylhexosaminidase